MPIEGLTSYVNSQPVARRAAITRKYTAPRRAAPAPRRYTSYSSPMPKRYVPPRRGTSGGGGGGGGGSVYKGGQYRESSGGQRGGVGLRGTPGGAAAGAIPTLAKYLAGDTAYQQSLRGGQRTLADFLSQMGRQRTEAGTSFTQSKALMEQDRVKQLKNLENEFASRGLLQSGIYATEQGDFQKAFQQQLDQLSQGQTSLLADLMAQETNFRREQSLAQEVAKQEALRRRAETYGI